MDSENSTPSTLMLEECFAAEDDRFLDVWVKFHSSAIIIPFMQKWLADERPWAKLQTVEYLRRDLNFSGHEVFLKRIFRHFEAARDHEMMSHFMVAFDRIVRRSRTTSFTWSHELRSSVKSKQLFAKPNKTIVDQTGRTVEIGTGRHRRILPLPDIRNRKNNRLFRQKTRNHLRRRVWRYFRWLSYSDPGAYLAAMKAALVAYKDEDFKAGENIIDNWSLMHACYFHSDELAFTAAHTNLKKGHSLSALVASPYRPELWQNPDSAMHLLAVLLEAQSSLARAWAIELLQNSHGEYLRNTNIKTLTALLSHSDSQVHEFALEIFCQHQGLGKLTVTDWLNLIHNVGHSLLPVMCESLKTHVAADRLDTQQIIQLAVAQAVPVAQLGFDMLQVRNVKTPLAVSELRTLSQAKCAAVAEPLTLWALGQLGRVAEYSADNVVDFFDALTEPVRLAAMDWVERPESPGFQDPVLWARLVETPFDDLRVRIVECLHRRTSLPDGESDALEQVWCAVLLGVHRGGRTKLKAMQQIQTAILKTPSAAARLLPVLSVAVRSLRGPERRGALAVVAALMVRNSAMQAEIREHLPELEWIG